MSKHFSFFEHLINLHVFIKSFQLLHRNPCLETEVNVEDDDEEWFPPTPPVYDVTEKVFYQKL